MFSRLASQLAANAHPPFDFAVVDEAQDVSVAQLRFLAALGADGRTASSSPATWASGSSSSPSRGNRWASMSAAASATLRINYRTSHQIRTQADRFLGRKCRMWTATSRNAAGTVSTCSTDRRRKSTFLNTPAGRNQGSRSVAWQS